MATSRDCSWRVAVAISEQGRYETLQGRAESVHGIVTFSLRNQILQQVRDHAFRMRVKAAHVIEG
ncbi:MAG: hypothetical protein AB1646_21660 [Thermodesulfobacteriota bacterium]